MKFKLQNYNEFKHWVRWYDYFSIMIHEFPVILFRRYDFLNQKDDMYSILVIELLGFTIYNSAK